MDLKVCNSYITICIVAQLINPFVLLLYIALHRVTLAILAQSAETLHTFDMEQIIQYIKTLPDHGVLDPDSLIATALSFNVTEQLLTELTQLYEYTMKHPTTEIVQGNRIPVAQVASASTVVRRRNNNT